MRRTMKWMVSAVGGLALAACGSTTGGGMSGGTTGGYVAGQPDPSCISVPFGIPAALDAGPDVHVGIQVYGSGTQNYTCGLVDAGLAGWGAAVPEANLYQCGPDGGQVGTHFAGPTWEWTADSSTFVGNKPTDVSVASPDDAGSDIPWLLLPKKSGTDAGVMGAVAYASRIETVGGQVALSDAGCDLAAADAGLVVKIPYNATYIFYYQDD
jgi:hypothetical protein